MSLLLYLFYKNYFLNVIKWIISTIIKKKYTIMSLLFYLFYKNYFLNVIKWIISTIIILLLLLFFVMKENKRNEIEWKENKKFQKKRKSGNPDLIL